MLTRNSSHGQPRLASTSCKKGSKDCLSGAVRLEAGTRVRSQVKKHRHILWQCWHVRVSILKRRKPSESQLSTHSVESLARCVPLADTPALDACGLGRRHDVSPAPVGFGFGTFWVSRAVCSGWRSVICAATQATSVSMHGSPDRTNGGETASSAMGVLGTKRLNAEKTHSMHQVAVQDYRLLCLGYGHDVSAKH